MNSIIITIPLRAIWKILAIGSVLFLLKGHNEPGGGFIGGLILAAALTIRELTLSSAAGNTRKDSALGHPGVIGGLVLVLVAVPIVPIVVSKGVFSGIWSQIYLPIAGKFSSVLVFDLVVYFIVAVFSLQSWRIFRGFKGGDAP